MAEKCVERLQRLINEKDQEELAARQAAKAQAEIARLAAMANQNVDTEINNLDSEMDSLSDADLKAKGRGYLYEKLKKAKELQEEKSRRSGG